MTVTIHIDQLEYFEGACKDQVDLFRKTFGDSVSFESKKEIIAAAEKYALQFDFIWAVHNLLEDFEDFWAQHKPILNAYKAQHKPLYEDYMAQCAELFAKMYWEQET